MRCAWSDIMSQPGSYVLLIGRLDDSFAGGQGDPYDGQRLRFAGELMKRLCTALALEGGIAIEGSRSTGGAVVHIAVESAADLERLSVLGASELVPAPPWKAKGKFELTEELHRRLLALAGPPDLRGAGRRARERKDQQEQDRSLRWNTDSGRGHP